MDSLVYIIVRTSWGLHVACCFDGVQFLFRGDVLQELDNVLQELDLDNMECSTRYSSALNYAECT